MYRRLLRPLRLLRRSVVAVFVCAVVLMPLVLLGVQVHKVFGSDGRKATPLPQFVQRQVDTKPLKGLFKEPLISVTFDDGWENSYGSSMPLLQKYGIHSTQYILSGVERDPGYLSWNQITAIAKAGHEIGCHSINHPDLTNVSDQELTRQLQGCKDTLSKRYGTITDFASPYGAYNSTTLAAIKKVYASQRNNQGAAVGQINQTDVNLASNFNANNIIGVSIHRDTTAAQLKALVDYTMANNGWLVLTYHQSDDQSSPYGLDMTSLKNQLKYLSGTPIRIVTVHQALSGLGK